MPPAVHVDHTMPLQLLVPKLWQRWMLFVGFWTLTAISFAAQFYFSTRHSALPVSWSQALLSSAADWFLFALLSVPIFRFARRFRFHKANWVQMLVIHFTVSLYFSLLYIGLRSGLAIFQSWMMGSPLLFIVTFQKLFIKAFHLNLWIYWVVIAVAHALDYYQRFHERELKTSELETNLVRARLHALQMQLNPHFLFNTLHSISALIHVDIVAADRMISQLSQLLRSALDSSNEQEVLLQREVDFLRRYLEIEGTRFGERLRFEFKIEEETLRCYVPNLILQPLVENAIRHGIEPHARPGLIQISGRIEGSNLHLSVADNGDGLKTRTSTSPGIGMANTRQRLEQLYGPRHRIELESSREKGLTVHLVIPKHLEPSLKPTAPSP